MAGYWRKPAETAEVLTAGWMHTGDVGFFDQAGWFCLVDRKKGETVVAFVSANPGVLIDVTALSHFCRERLAAYKCPVEIRVVEELPKTATGKITRNTLRDEIRSR